MKNKNKNRKSSSDRRPTRLPVSRYAIFYKSHGFFIGPYGGITLTEQQIRRLTSTEEMTHLRNYILRSPLLFRPVQIF